MGNAVSAQRFRLIGKGIPAEVTFLVVLALAAIFVAHLGTMENLLHRWEESGEYSNGYFIPFITAWLLWMRRDAIQNSIGQPTWFGVALVLLSVLMLVGGELTYIFVLSHLSLIISLIGLVACIGGLALLRVCWVPLAFLLFMIPLPYYVGTVLTWKLQLISSVVGSFFIRLLDIPVFLDGNIIDLGTHKIGVVEACSGLRYLMPLLSIGFLAAYLFQGRLWQRALIFISVFPIAILMNGIRLAFVAVLLTKYNISSGTGFMHLFEGWVVFVGCIAILYLVMILLARLNPSPHGLLKLPTFETSARNTVGKTYDLKPLASATLVLIAAAIAVQFGLQRAISAPQRADLSQLPFEFDRSWRHTIQDLDPEVEEVLGADDYLIADFKNADGAVNIYVSYLDAQRDGRSWHSPRQCIPGGGWKITELTRKPVAATTGSPFTVNRVTIERSGSRALVYYWYQQRGRKIADEWMMKYYLIVDALTKNRTDGALIRLTTPIITGESVDKAERRLSTVLGILDTRLPKYIPN